MPSENTFSIYRPAVEASLKIIPDLPDKETIERLLNSTADSRIVRLGADQIEQLIDGLFTAFLTRGLQLDHEPDAFGYEIEGWIDCLNVAELYQEESPTESSQIFHERE